MSMGKPNGYMGKILRIDMTNKTTSDMALDEATLRDYFGGLALGAKLLYDLVPPEADELGPENKVILTTSPVTGTSAPGVCMVNVMTKSPLINSTIGAQMNGFLGRQIKTTGYDGIIIEGQSDTWQYVSVIDGKVEFCDATELLGKDCFETEDYLKEKLNQPKSSVFCIGPAGENLVKFAGIEADKGHFASSGGPGAVMGSKKLKAVLLSGNSKIEIARPEEFKALLKPWIEALNALPVTTAYKVAGSQSTFSGQLQMGMVPVKNLQRNTFEQAELFDGIAIHTKNPGIKFKREGCYACPIAHCMNFEITEGPRKGATGDDAEYEGLANFGPNLMVTDPLDAIYLSNINDRLGMDLKESGFLISWAMECYEKGYITKDDADGIDLSWGNVEAVEELLNRIAKREGKFGEMLSEGIWRASTKVGGEAAKCAVYTKRHGPHGHDPRAVGLAFGQSVSDMGSMHGGNPTTPEPACGLSEAVDARDPEKNAWGSAVNSKRTIWRDSMLICMFTEKAASVDDLVKVANAVTGFDLTPEEAMMAGARANHLMRAFNLLAGLTPEDDTCSHRLLNEAPTEGPFAGQVMADTFEIKKRAWYEGMGWDRETSKPLPETLKKAGLDALIPALWGN